MPPDLEIPERTDANILNDPSATTGVSGEVKGLRRIELPVSGLTCANCVQAVERALRAVSGVRRATANLATGRAFVEYDPAMATVSALHEAIKAAGYRSETAKTRFTIQGITCASCVVKIENTLRETPGVLSASVSVGTEEALVEYLPSVADLAMVKAAVGSAGYKVNEAPTPAGPDALDREAEAREREYRTLRPFRSSLCPMRLENTSSLARWECFGASSSWNRRRKSRLRNTIRV